MTDGDNKPDEVEPPKYWCLVARALRKIAHDLNYRTPQNNRELRYAVLEREQAAALLDYVRHEECARPLLTAAMKYFSLQRDDLGRLGFEFEDFRVTIVHTPGSGRCFQFTSHAKTADNAMLPKAITVEAEDIPDETVLRVFYRGLVMGRME
jgi:hypothetical protein